MEQQTYRILTDTVGHGIKHLITAHLILNQRIPLGISLQADSLTQLIHIVNMGHPLVIDNLQQNNPFQFTDSLRFREFRFLAFIQLHSFFFQLLLQVVSLRTVHT